MLQCFVSTSGMHMHGASIRRMSGGRICRRSGTPGTPRRAVLDFAAEVACGVAALFVEWCVVGCGGMRTSRLGCS